MIIRPCEIFNDNLVKRRWKKGIQEKLYPMENYGVSLFIHAVVPFTNMY